MTLARYMVAAALLCVNIAYAAPDERQLGGDERYPVGSQENWFVDQRMHVGSFSRFETIFPHRVLAKAPGASVLAAAKNPPDIRYEIAGRSYTIDDFLQRQRITGLLIIKDGEILTERYQYGRQASDRFLSFSMAKSITSLAVGLALEEGKIGSLDDRIVKYIPELAGSAYGDGTIRNILRMASGVNFVENYRADDDLARFIGIWKSTNLIDALNAFRQKDGAQGTHFAYATSNTYLLGLLVSRATGKTLSAYVDEKIWQPMGAESDAMFGIEKDGNEYAGTRFMAVLRDYGRLGMLLANDGKLNGKQILPQAYLLEATDAHRQPEAFAPGKATPYFGYGYQFWLLPGAKRQFALNGVHGQMIYVDPDSKTVMVHTGVAKNANIFVGDPMGAESLALWRGVTGAPQKTAVAVSPVLPPGAMQLTLDSTAAFRSNDMTALKALYHPRYLQSGRDRDAQMQFLASQAMGRVKQWNWQIDSFEQQGHIAHVKAVIVTEFGEYPTETNFIDEDDHWYFYGNQKK